MSRPGRAHDRSRALPFPRGIPGAYHPLADEPRFNPSRHLDLRSPAATTSLEELGYSASDIARCPSSLGYTAAFKILSDEGVAAMRALCARIYHNRNASDGTGKQRLGSFVRGAGYRSRFIRDFCDSPELLEYLSSIAGVRLGRHSVPGVACGINYAPEEVGKAVDTWHVDSVAFDMVLMVSDPAQVEGGEFQAFRGTREEGRRRLGIGGEEGRDLDLPADRVETIPFPGAGYGFLQQGNMIFHRACRLRRPAERVTMVPAFEVLPAHVRDATNSVNMLRWSDPGLPAELSRRELWRAAARLDDLVGSIELQDEPRDLGRAIDEALAPLTAFRRALGGGE